MVFCAKMSIINKIFHRAGLRTRRIKEFPFYKVHELYRSTRRPDGEPADHPETGHSGAAGTSSRCPVEYDVERFPR